MQEIVTLTERPLCYQMPLSYGLCWQEELVSHFQDYEARVFEESINSFHSLGL